METGVAGLSHPTNAIARGEAAKSNRKRQAPSFSEIASRVARVVMTGEEAIRPDGFLSPVAGTLVLLIAVRWPINPGLYGGVKNLSRRVCMAGPV